ncbi:unnamed protein product [Phyllotreta striolata]|uniref:Uncharacterized protein n=2 Tax=Chrysomeloidea TaxID=71528 RepID=A0A9N9XV91_PHYSR|nr:unnamed protein product [Phyllotreta striolata]
MTASKGQDRSYVVKEIILCIEISLNLASPILSCVIQYPRPCQQLACMTRSIINKPVHNRPVEESGLRHFLNVLFVNLCTLFVVFTFDFWLLTMDTMDIKVDTVNLFDINKICRACLTDKGEMRSVFMQDDTSGQPIIIAEMLMEFTSVEIKNGDGLPSLICLQCMHEINRCNSFKQLFEQSDVNLRTYLGKPINQNQRPFKEEAPPQSDFSSFFLDNFGMDSSSSDSDDDDYKDEFQLLQTSLPDNSNDEKIIAQKQLIKAGRFHKTRISKKRLLAKAGKTSAAKRTKRNTNQCNVCKKQFINLKSFRKHLRTHIEDRPFKCKVCNRGFTEENYLNNHMRTHVPDDQKPHECEVCKKRFIHNTLLTKHMLKHSGEKPFVCKICNKGCYAENSLLKHMKIHEKKEGDPALLKHICDYCRTEFPDSASLSVHIKQHTGDRPFVCNICGKCFPQRFNLELHCRTHTGERPFQCEVCKNGYVSKASLKIHMRTHTNERPFVCDFCGKAFRQSGDLTSHKRLHGTEKPIECSVCQKRFTTVMKLKYHMRNHTGERPYVCTVCGRGFTVNTILLRHMRVHSGERPYVCVTCGKAFSQSSTLNTHMKIHNPSNSSNHEREQKFQAADEQKYQSQDQGRLMQQQQQQHMQQEPVQRMLQAQQLSDGTRILADASQLLADPRLLANEGARLLVNVTEPPPLRLLVNDNARLITNDNRLLSQDNRLIANVNVNVNDNRLLGDNARHLSVLDGSRILTTDKYLASYDPYQRGQL